MSNQLDGIKKLTPEEKKQSRQIVLDFIGENQEHDEKPLKPVETAKKALPAQAMPVAPSAESIREQERIRMSGMEKRKKAMDLALSDDARQRQREKLLQERTEKENALSPEEAARSSARAEKSALTSPLLSESIDKSVQKKKALMARLKDEQKIAALAEKNKELEIMRAQEKKAQEDKRLELLRASQMKIKKEEKAKEEATKKPNVQLRKNKSFLLKFSWKNKNSIDFIKKSKTSIKRIIIWLIIIFLTLLIIYVAWYISVVKINFHNKASGQAAKILPLPVIMSNFGYIDYYEYEKLKNSILANPEHPITNDQLIKNYLVLKKYLINNNIRDKTLFDAIVFNIHRLDLLLTKDHSVNASAIARISRIQALLKQGRGFGDVRSLGDDYSFGEFVSFSEAGKKFDQSITNLSIGQISNIVHKEDGYYLVQIISYGTDKMLVNYIFVKAKALNEFLDDESKKVKIWLTVSSNASQL